MVVGGGFEPPKLSRQIYSLIPLATREPHHGRTEAARGLFFRSGAILFISGPSVNSWAKKNRSAGRQYPTEDRFKVFGLDNSRLYRMIRPLVMLFEHLYLTVQMPARLAQNIDQG